MFNEPIIHVIVTKATQDQVRDMLSYYGNVMKVAVDIERGILAGGGEMHADCEGALVQLGSWSDDIWGANWTPSKQEIEFMALLNIKARLNNRNMYLQDPVRRDRVQKIVEDLLGGVYP
jgi:hypothetical protein